jgi:hypothetical protein
MKQEFSIKQSKALDLVIGLFALFLIWRIALYFVTGSVEGEIFLPSFAWGATYQVIAIFGAIAGIVIAQSWGGIKSVLGRAILAFSVGLLFQSIGQTFSSYYVYTLGEIPYPSWGDLGFFGSVLFYIYGTITLAKLAGVKVNIKSFSKKILAFIIPLAGLILSYLIFLKDHQLDFTQPLSVLLDIGYPLGQAFYVSVALLVYFFSRDVLGGIMRMPIIFFIIALISQYLSDFMFLYQVTREIYVPEGVIDLMYFVSYFFMAVSLLRLGTIFNKMRNS